MVKYGEIAGLLLNAIAENQHTRWLVNVVLIWFRDIGYG
jgi:hypothetical protein